MTTQKVDDLEAVRVLVETLKDFSAEEQQRIIRWSAEKLGTSLPNQASTQFTAALAQGPAIVAPSTKSSDTSQATHPGRPDIKTFMLEKNPRNDVQFAAAAAYYYRFEAPQSERKEWITKEDLQEAARKASRERFANPGNTLNNAHKLGLLDKGSEKATFVINSVGENLVAMTLPDGATIAKQGKGRRTKKLRPAAKKASKQAKKKA